MDNSDGDLESYHYMPHCRFFPAASITKGILIFMSTNHNICNVCLSTTTVLETYRDQTGLDNEVAHLSYLPLTSEFYETDSVDAL